MTTQQKYETLQHILKDMGSVAVAYSGGVDSTFLLKAAFDVLKDDAIGILAVSPSFPSREYQRAVEAAGTIGARLEIIHTNEMDPSEIDRLLSPEIRIPLLQFFKKIGYNTISVD